ncbi:hypothetical protein GGR51DRAFT_564700 [Nemania sp. FL0031]|nr:hypothetical protein GGR51DRAFT_564700 [Nemania sp. FL0031]
MESERRSRACLAERFEVVVIESRPEIGGPMAPAAKSRDSRKEKCCRPYTIESDSEFTSRHDQLQRSSLDPTLYGHYFGHRRMLAAVHP